MNFVKTIVLKKAQEFYLGFLYSLLLIAKTAATKGCSSNSGRHDA